MATRTPTCLSCLRRIAAPGPIASSVSTSSAWAPRVPSFSGLQVRGKSKHTYDEGVVVRLLEDIPRYGRKDAIFKVGRGRMRNLWYPAKKAEYMTPERFAELGLSKRDAIGERDPMFRANTEAQDAINFLDRQVEVNILSSRVEDDQTMAPERTYALLKELIPQVLTFHRKPIPAPAAAAAPELEKPNKVSPLLASNIQIDEPEPNPTTEPASDKAIFGSVSTADVLAVMKAALKSDRDGAKIPLETKDLRFLGLGKGDGADRVKSLGWWEVEITVPGASDSVPDVQFVKKLVEVVPDDALPAEDTE